MLRSTPWRGNRLTANGHLRLGSPACPHYVDSERLKEPMLPLLRSQASLKDAHSSCMCLMTFNICHQDLLPRCVAFSRYEDGKCIVPIFSIQS